MQKGFSRIYIDGEIIRIEDIQDKKNISTVFTHKMPYVLIDRLVVKDFDEDDKHRIADSVTTHFMKVKGKCH
jgi:Excinuclease ATPase subunit